MKKILAVICMAFAINAQAELQRVATSQSNMAWANIRATPECMAGMTAKETKVNGVRTIEAALPGCSRYFVYDTDGYMVITMNPNEAKDLRAELKAYRAETAELVRMARGY
ncbi:hypothetical protein [Burkholderia phage BCSR5]|nr:hypothetical protein [Burkholderia phage BCSR5]